MEKKKYEQLQVMVYSVKPGTILDGSNLQVSSSGSTSEQCSKSGFGFDDDDEEDNY